MTHTPGPWTIKQRQPRGQGPAILSGREVVAQVKASPGAWGDGFLIAAAPEMLATLRKSTEGPYRFRDDDWFYCIYCGHEVEEPSKPKDIVHRENCWLLRAQAVIAQAEGRS